MNTQSHHKRNTHRTTATKTGKMASGKISLTLAAGLIVVAAMSSLLTVAVGGADKAAIAIESDMSALQPVASVNGELIPASRLNDMMLRAWGYEAVNQLIGDTLVSQAAIKAGVNITDQDVAREQQITLEAIMPQVQNTSPESVLDELLKSRNVPRHLWDVTMRRNAILRKLAEKRVMITDEMLTNAYNNQYGLKVQIRHIQCASMSDAQKIYDMLKNGDDFAEVARKYSINTESAANGGLIMHPFSRDDASIPEIIRQSAFNLPDGRLSEILQDNRYYHIIRREKTIAPDSSVTFDQVRPQLAQQLTRELVHMIQPRILDELRKQADIVLLNPVLKQIATQQEAAAR